MAQIASLATLAVAGASVYSAARQSSQQAAQAKAQQAQAQALQDAGAKAAAVQQAATQRARDQQVAGTVASARARLAAGGVSPDEGSTAALTAGLQASAAAAQSDSDALFNARLAAGRRSLLNGDGSLTPWLRAGTSFGTAVRSLLD